MPFGNSDRRETRAGRSENGRLCNPKGFVLRHVLQGSSFLATLGFDRESLWDSVLGWLFLLPALFAFSSSPILAADNAQILEIGVAKIDVTPSYPIRLTGYAVRKTESEGTEQRLWARALAIGSDRDGAAILMTVDNCGICANVTEEVAARLKKKAGIARERFAVCSSHTHTGPCTVGFAPNIFAMPIPPEQHISNAQFNEL